MEGDVVYDAAGVFKGEESRPAGIERDGAEGDDSLLAGDPIVVPECEAPLTEFGVPADAVKEQVERLHAASACHNWWHVRGATGPDEIDRTSTPSTSLAS
jgi:hypothetical protein